MEDDLIKKKLFKDYLDNPPSTMEELKNWILLFLDLDLPESHLPDEGSNSSPMEALWTSFNNYKNNNGGEEPGYIWLSSRDSMKTLAASILAVTMLVFFDASICWLASIEPQSKIALGNVQSFTNRLIPFLEHCGKSIQSNNARNLEIVTSDGKKALINVLVATMSSVNGRHVNAVFCDETDLLRDPRVLDEVQAVASLIGNQFPLKVYFSTRKFSFGNMEKLIQDKESLGLKMLKWDILDVTEHCPPSTHRPDLPMETVFVHPDPPLRALTDTEYAKLTDVERKQYEPLKVYSGCVGCKLVSQCKTRLAHRPEKDKGKLWKKISHTINMFRSMSPDMATAQLLCRKPSLSGLVYPRFDEDLNTLTPNQAWEAFIGGIDRKVTLDELVDKMLEHDITFYVGGDWGSTAAQAFVVAAVMPGGDFWIVDSYAISGLQFDDVLELGKKIRDRYSPKHWYMDTNQPMFIMAFNKNGMRCIHFIKDVMGGIESIRSQIVNASNLRKLKVIKQDRTEIVMECFRKHHFILDSLGKPTDKPDDGKAWSDIGDSIRYLGQNLFAIKGAKPTLSTGLADTVAKPTDPGRAILHDSQQKAGVVDNFSPRGSRADIVRAMQDGASPAQTDQKPKNTKKGVFWDFGND